MSDDNSDGVFMIRCKFQGDRPPAHVAYFKDITVWGGKKAINFCGFQHAAVLGSEEAAEIQLKKMAEVTQAETIPLEDLPYEIVNVEEMTPCPIFEESLPLDRAHVPFSGQVVEIRWRDGQWSDVSGDFIRDELLAGRWHSDPRVCRWK